MNGFAAGRLSSHRELFLPGMVKSHEAVFVLDRLLEKVCIGLEDLYSLAVNIENVRFGSLNDSLTRSHPIHHCRTRTTTSIV